MERYTVSDVPELSNELYYNILENVKDPETYQSFSKVNRNLRELSRSDVSMKHAKEKFFGVVEPYFYKMAKKMIHEYFEEEYWCEDVDNIKAVKISELLKEIVVAVKVEGVKATDGRIERLVNGYSYPITRILTGIAFDTSKDLRMAISKDYKFTLQGVIMQILNDHGLY